MVKKLEKFLHRTWVIVIAIPLLLFAAIIGWAITGPRDISSYIPYIEDSLDGVLEGYDVSIQSAYLKWGGIDEKLQIEANNVVVRDSQSKEVIAIPSLDLDYHLLYLLSGELIPSEIEVNKAKIDLKGIATEDTSIEADYGELDFSALNIGKLSRLSFSDTAIILPNYDQEWKVNYAFFTMVDGKIHYGANFNDTDKENTHLKGTVGSVDKGIDIYVEAENCNSKDYKDYLPQLANYDLSLDLKSDIIISRGEPVSASVSVANVKGNLLKGEVFREDIKVNNAEFQLTHDVKSGITELVWLDANVGSNIAITGKGTASAADNMSMHFGVENLPIADLVKIWPNNVGASPYRWISKNITKGAITKASAVINLKPEYFETELLPDEAVDVKFEAKDLLVNYRAGLIPAKVHEGSAHLDGNSISFDFKNATVGSSKISNPAIEITGLGGDKAETIEIVGTIAGPVADLADFYGKLAGGKKFFKKEDVTGGKSTTNLELVFPLIATLPKEKVKYNISTKVEGANIKNFFNNFNVTETDFDLKINNKGFEAKGGLVASMGDASEQFSLQNAPANFVFEQAEDGGMSFSAGLDLTNSSISIPVINVQKNPGEAGSLEIAVSQNEKADILHKAKLSSAPINFNASGSFANGFEDIVFLDFDYLSFGKTSLAGRLVKNEYYQASFAGNSFDLTPILNHMDKEEDDSVTPNFQMSVSATQLIIKNGQFLNNANLQLLCLNNECNNLSLKSDKSSVTLANNNLQIITSDAGSLLKGFDAYEYMSGGRLQLDATLEGDNYQGGVVLKDFTITKGKFLPKILLLGSLKGISDVLQGEGISFKKLTSRFAKSGSQVSIEAFRAYGPAIGMTADGYFDEEKDIIRLSGNIIPAYTANTLLGKIPLLGDIIIGDDGIFAIAYNLKGKFSDPETSVNPLSVLAPGILKEVFN